MLMAMLEKTKYPAVMVIAFSLESPSPEASLEFDINGWAWRINEGSDFLFGGFF
jgi:hypothetical protein